MSWRLRSRWLIESGRSIAIGCLIAVALHVPFLGGALHPDEGGFLLVARQWHDEGPSLYGHLWVDRPPLLLLAFRAVDTVLGAGGIRVVACLAAVLLVVTAGWAGWQVGGAAGARWASLTAAAMGSSYAVGAYELNGELLAAPVMMLACGCILHALHRAGTDRRRALWAVAAGIAATSAVLVKQNFVDALVFSGVLVLASMRWGNLSRKAGRRLLGSLVVGALLPVAGTMAWAYQHDAGLGELWYMLYGFRAAAIDVIADRGVNMPLTRFAIIVGLAVVSGIAMLVWRFVHSTRREVRRRDPFTLATLAMLFTGVAGILLGGGYWSHYLIGVGPALALASAAVGARTDGHGRWMRRWVLVAVVSACIATATGAAATAASGGAQAPATAIGEWLKVSAGPRDTAVVTYGQANVLATAGLSTPYPYLWSLPVRTLDPQLTRLTRTLRGPRAPTWVVEWYPINTWQLDRHGRLARTLSSRYRPVATVCGHRIFLRLDVSRDLAKPPADCGD